MLIAQSYGNYHDSVTKENDVYCYWEIEFVIITSRPRGSIIIWIAIGYHNNNDNDNNNSFLLIHRRSESSLPQYRWLWWWLLSKIMLQVFSYRAKSYEIIYEILFNQKIIISFTEGGGCYVRHVCEAYY